METNYYFQGQLMESHVIWIIQFSYVPTPLS
jgi:hypothetical protein